MSASVDKIPRCYIQLSPVYSTQPALLLFISSSYPSSAPCLTLLRRDALLSTLNYCPFQLCQDKADCAEWDALEWGKRAFSNCQSGRYDNRGQADWSVTLLLTAAVAGEAWSAWWVCCNGIVFSFMFMFRIYQWEMMTGAVFYNNLLLDVNVQTSINWRL